MASLKSIVKELEEETTTAYAAEPTLDYDSITKLASIMEAAGDKFSAGVRLVADELKSYLDRRKLAEHIVTELVKQGSLEDNKILIKLDELENKDSEELKIMSAALKLSKTGGFMLGSLSDEEEPKAGFGSNAAEALEYIIEKVKGE